MTLPAGYALDPKNQATDGKAAQPPSIAELKEQAAKLRPSSTLGVDQPTTTVLRHLRAPSLRAKTTEESEHARQVKPAQPLETALPDWSKVRAGVMQATAPTQTGAPTEQAGVADVTGDVMKRAGRSLFGIVDFIPQTAGILKNLFSSDEKVSAQAESDLLNLHPGAQISDRAKEAIEEYKKSPKLAATNVAGDALALFLADKLGKITEPEIAPKVGEAPKPEATPPQAAPPTIEQVLPESAKVADRRVNLAERKRVSEMSIEDLRKELLTSDKTGIPNRRAFDDAERQRASPAVAMSDADGLKALNDKFGYQAGDQLLKAKAEALKEAGLDAYHEKGDEFLYRGETPESLKEKLEKAREILRNRVIEVKMKDGTTKRFKGADFSYGTGTDLAESESGLKQHKSAREAAGERARGELRGITEAGPEASAERPDGAEPGGAAPASAEPATDTVVAPKKEPKAKQAPIPLGADGKPVLSEGDIEHWGRYTNSLKFKTEDEARQWVFDKLQREDESSSAAVFGKNGPEKNRTIADSIPLHKDGRQIKIGRKAKAEATSKERLGVAKPEGDAPNVDWSKQDLQDRGRVSKESILRDYNGGKPAEVYQAYIDPEDMPAPELAEEMDVEQGEEPETSYAWDELRMSGRYRPTPPMKVRVKKNGKVEILDGNHRLTLWQERGFSSYPAWVIDERKGIKGLESEE